MVEFEDSFSERMAQLEQEDLERYQRDVLKNSSYSYEDETANYDEFQSKLIVLMDLVRGCINDFQRTPLNGYETHTTELQSVDDVVSYDRSGLEFEANDEKQSDEELVVSALLDSTEIQRDDDIYISVEDECIENNQQAEPYAHKPFDNMPTFPSIEQKEENVRAHGAGALDGQQPDCVLKVNEMSDSDEIQSNESAVKSVGVLFPNPFVKDEETEPNEGHEGGSGVVFYSINRQLFLGSSSVTTMNGSSNGSAKACLEGAGLIIEVVVGQNALKKDASIMVKEMPAAFRADAMNKHLIAPYIRGINVHNITLFDPGGDRKFSMSSSEGVVPKLFGKAHGTCANGVEGVDWGKIVMKKGVDRVLEGIPHSNSIGIQGAKDVLDENVNVALAALGRVDDRIRLVLLLESIVQGDKSQVDVLEDSALNVFDEVVLNPTYSELAEEFHDIETAITEKDEKALKVECLRVSGNVFDDLLSTMFIFDPGISSQLDEMFQSFQEAQLKELGVTSSQRHTNLFINTTHRNSLQALFQDMDKCTAAVVILRASKYLEGAIIHMFVIIHPKDDVPAGLPIQMIPFEVAGRILHTVSTLLSSDSSGYPNAVVQRVIHSSLHLLDGFKTSQSGAKRCNNAEHLYDNLLNEIGVPIVTLVDHFSEMFGSNEMNIGLNMSRPKHFGLGLLLSGSKKFAQYMLANDNDNVAIATLEDFIWDPGLSVTSFYILEDKDGFKGVGKDRLTIVIMRRRDDLTDGKLVDTTYYGALENLKWYEQRKLQGAENGKVQHDMALRMWPQLRNKDFRCLVFGAQLWMMSCVKADCHLLKKMLEPLLFKHSNGIMVFIFHPGERSNHLMTWNWIDLGYPEWGKKFAEAAQARQQEMNVDKFGTSNQNQNRFSLKSMYLRSNLFHLDAEILVEAIQSFQASALLILAQQYKMVNLGASLLSFLKYVVSSNKAMVFAVGCDIFVWDPGVAYYHFTTLRTRRVLRGRCCHDLRSIIRNNSEGASMTIKYQLLAVSCVIWFSCDVIALYMSYFIIFSIPSVTGYIS